MKLKKLQSDADRIRLTRRISISITNDWWEKLLEMCRKCGLKPAELGRFLLVKGLKEQKDSKKQDV